MQIILAAVFLAAAIPKLTDQHSSVQMFGTIGAGHWLQYLVGAAELAGAVGLLVPVLIGLAAAGLAADMVGASIINIVVLHSPAVVLTVPLCAVLVLVARKRWVGPRTLVAAIRRLAGDGTPQSEAV